MSPSFKISIPTLTLLTKADLDDEKYLNQLALWSESYLPALQLRAKCNDSQELIRWGKRLKKILNPKTQLIINDFPELVLEIGAQGVHLGQNDAHPNEARKIIGANKIIGWSVSSEQELKEANQLDSLNYIAASAVFPTDSKDNVNHFWGLEGLLYLVKHSKHPVIAIGGIDHNRAPKVVKTGVCGLAVIGAIHEAKNPQQEIKFFTSLFENGSNKC